MASSAKKASVIRKPATKETVIFGYRIDMGLRTTLLYGPDRNGPFRKIALPVFNRYFPLADDPERQDKEHMEYSIGYGKLQIFLEENPEFVQIRLATKYWRLEDKHEFEGVLAMVSVPVSSRIFSVSESVAEDFLSVSLKKNDNVLKGDEIIENVIELFDEIKWDDPTPRVISVLTTACARGKDPEEGFKVPKMAQKMTATQLASFMIATGRVPKPADIHGFLNRERDK